MPEPMLEKYMREIDELKDVGQYYDEHHNLTDDQIKELNFSELSQYILKYNRDILELKERWRVILEIEGQARIARKIIEGTIDALSGNRMAVQTVVRRMI
jgi:hypothetical protein